MAGTLRPPVVRMAKKLSAGEPWNAKKHPSCHRPGPACRTGQAPGRGMEAGFGAATLPRALTRRQRFSKAASAAAVLAESPTRTWVLQTASHERRHATCTPVPASCVETHLEGGAAEGSEALLAFQLEELPRPPVVRKPWSVSVAGTEQARDQSFVIRTVCATLNGGEEGACKPPEGRGRH
jgi:hypothetical protein